MIMINLPLFVINYIYEFMIRKSHHGALVRQIIEHDYERVFNMLLFQYSLPSSIGLINESDYSRLTEFTRTLCPKNKSVTFTVIEEPFIGLWREQCSYYTYTIGNDTQCYSICDDRTQVHYNG